ncbi:MAG: transposase [Rhizobiaceae bacterium]|nr:transposase [Rhizobiaceae bacterium]
MSATMRDDRTFHVIEAVPDRLEGAPRRVRREWSEAFKVRLVAETLVPGANVSAIARREGIAPSQLFGWRRQAIRNGTVTPPETKEGPHFVEVDTAVSSVIEIVLEGAVVRVGADVPEAHLRRVIRALRSA